MSYKNCVNNAAEEGKISKEKQKEQLELIENLERRYIGEGLNPTEASRKAAKDAYNKLKFDASHKKYVNRLKFQNLKRIDLELENYRNAKGEPDAFEAAEAIYVRSENATYASLETLIYQEEALASKYLDELMAELKPSVGGYVNKKKKATMMDVVRALFNGKSSNESANEFAKAWTLAAERLRLRFNKYGGRIPKLKDWGIPMSHDFIKVRKASVDEWIEFVIRKLNIGKMIDNTTGLPFTEESLRLVLGKVYQDISELGVKKLKPGSGRGASLANKRLDHRFLIFKDADSWLQYAERFGEGDIFSIMMGHIKSMARDTGMLKRLGPNPEFTHRYIKDKLRISGVENRNLKRKGLFNQSEENRIASYRDKLDNYFAYFKGHLSIPANIPFARTMAGIRQVITSSVLGSASILAVGDFNFGRITAQFNDIGAFGQAQRATKILGEAIKKDKTMSKVALRSGLIAESFATVAHTSQRYTLDTKAPEITRRFADATLKLSGLTDLTQGGRWGFGMELMGFFADNVNKTFDELLPGTKRMFKRYGIESDSWDVIRKTKLYDAGIDDPKVAGQDITFLRPDDIRARTDITADEAENLATKMFDLISSETEFAVPSTSAKFKALALARAKPGTILGEAALSGLMFKSFAFTLVFTHLNRAMRLQGKAKYGYFADLIISSAIMGSLAFELRELTKGREPTSADYIKKNPGEYFTRMLMTGGGLGIFGDFFLADHNRYGGSMTSTAMGPVAGLIENLYKLGPGQLMKAVRGDKLDPGNQAIRMIKQYTPGSSIWYLRLAFERLIADRVANLVDPDVQRRRNRLINSYLRDTQQEYWWKPGDISPN